METNCAPPIADLFLFYWERDFVLSLSLCLSLSLSLPLSLSLCVCVRVCMCVCACVCVKLSRCWWELINSTNIIVPDVYSSEFMLVSATKIYHEVFSTISSKSHSCFNVKAASWLHFHVKMTLFQTLYVCWEGVFLFIAIHSKAKFLKRTHLSVTNSVVTYYKVSLFA